MNEEDRNVELATQTMALRREMVEHTQARARLQQYADMLDLSPILILDLDGRILFWNQGAHALYGWTQDEAVGQNALRLFQTQFPESPERIREDLLRHGSWAGDLIHTTKEGKLITVASHSVLRRGPDGQPEAILVVSNDISEQVRLRQQLHENERLVAIGMTAAKLAHEIGNPLHGMSLASKLLRDILSKQPSNERIETLLRILIEETDRLKELLEDFRGLSRRQVLTVTVVDLNTIVRDVLTSQQAVCAELHLDVAKRLSATLPVMQADVAKLKQALLNLIKNAVEAMPQGGTLTVHTHYAEPMIHLDIADTGVGISPDVKIFEPFVTTKPKGSGLGMPVIKQVVDLHGGTLSYVSEMGKGTTFHIELPLSPPEPPAFAGQ